MINTIYTMLTIVVGALAILGPVGAILALIFIPGVALPVLKALVTRFLRCTICIVLVTILVSSLVSYWIGRKGSYQRGVDDTIAGIARNNTQLVDRARRARGKLKDCQARNMTWVQSTGECR